MAALCEHSLVEPHPAQPGRSALPPLLPFKVVGTKVKLQHQALEKLRQLDFVAVADPVKADCV